MSIICNSINQCYDREVYLHNVKFIKTPKLCPYCGEKWYVSAINELISQADSIEADAKKL